MTKRKPSKQTIEQSLSGVGALLRTDTLTVPRYQRDFAWKQTEVDDLLVDLSSALADDGSQHFLGAAVFTRLSNNHLEIVDGQQRIATSMMILCAIRDQLETKNEERKAAAIQSTYIYYDDISSGKKLPRLTLNSTDNPFFQSQVIESNLNEAKISSSKDSHKKILNAYKQVKKQIDTIDKSAGNRGASKLIKLVELINAEAVLTKVVVPDHSTAFTIFETLNHRGISLATTDLLKNFFFATAKRRINEAEAFWLKTMSILESTGEKDAADQYIHHFWSSRHGLTRKRNIFKSAKKTVNNSTKTIIILDDLQRNARFYASISNPDHLKWKRYGPEAQEHLRSLNTLKVSLVRPILLSVFDCFKNAEVLKTLRLLISASVRIIVSSARSGTIEKIYADAALKIRTKEITGSRQLQTFLSPHIPANKQFEVDFSNSRFSTNYSAKYFLRGIERYLNSASPGYASSLRDSDVTLEHILPKKPENNWPLFSEQDHEDFVYRIGNLCLLSEEDNSREGNSPYNIKLKNSLSKSPYKITNSLTEYPDFTPDAIEKRSRDLASLASKTWPFSDKMAKISKSK